MTNCAIKQVDLVNQVKETKETKKTKRSKIIYDEIDYEKWDNQTQEDDLMLIYENPQID